MAAAVKAWSPVTMATLMPAPRAASSATPDLGPGRVVQADQPQQRQPALNLLEPEAGAGQAGQAPLGHRQHP